MKLLRCAIEATCLANLHPTGISRYTRHLVLELAKLDGEAAPDLTLLYRASRWKRRERLPEGPRSHRQLWHRGWWPPAKPYDLVHCPDHRLPHWDLPKLVTVHDVYSAVGINFEDPVAREKQNGIYRDFSKRADRIVFDSAHTRADFLRFFPYDEARTDVVHLGVTEEFHPRSAEELAVLPARFGLSRPYLLFLGLQNANKNLARLLQAFAQSPLRHDHQLLLAGKVPASQAEALTQRVEGLGLKDAVRFGGYVGDAEVPLLYAGAAALMFPSLYEGFGLPILEAMASGTPVMTSTASSCPEVAAGHAVLADPESVAEMAAAIERAVRMSEADRAAARAYALTCTWRRTAEQTFAVYRKLAAT
ncbi:MAG TPA: glycosyltransferase family 1 protein [Solimonas sp.]|nr:glycosyltransferase family 1 protein [Solimonas sp.]